MTHYLTPYLTPYLAPYLTPYLAPYLTPYLTPPLLSHTPWAVYSSPQPIFSLTVPFAQIMNVSRAFSRLVLDDCPLLSEASTPRPRLPSSPAPPAPAPAPDPDPDPDPYFPSAPDPYLASAAPLSN